MASLLDAQLLATVFGILGNIVSFLVFLAPVPTFYKIYTKKTSEGYESIPYIVALLSATLLLYYASLKTSNAYMIITINAIGCVIELTYIAFYLTYAPKQSKICTMRNVMVVNIGGLGLVILFTYMLVEAPHRASIVGWICAAFNLAVFAAPLSIMTKVIRTKSVKYMSFWLSFSLTLCATVWFFYGFFSKDLYIAVPNVIGFLFGINQMILYTIYKQEEKDVATRNKADITMTSHVIDVEDDTIIAEVEMVVLK